MPEFRNASVIKKSILTNLANDWNTDIQQFDPFVDKLAGALASELEHLYTELGNRDEHMIQRLSRVMLPDIYAGPKAALGIAKAELTVNFIDLKEETPLVYTKQHFNQEEENWNFTPGKNTRLLNARLRYLLTNSSAYELQQHRLQLISRPQTEPELMTSLLIGIEMTPELLHLHHLHIYFDLSSTDQEANVNRYFIKALQDSTASVDQQEVIILPGIFDPEGDRQKSPEVGCGPWQELESVLTKNFITILPQQADLSLNSAVDSGFEILRQFVVDSMGENRLKESFLAKIRTDSEKSQNNLIWLKIHLRSPLSIPKFDQLFYGGLNHFPIINRNYKRVMPNPEFERGQPQVVSIIEEEAQFLTIKEVSHYPTGKQLQAREGSHFDLKEQETYTIRKNDVGRIDSYNIWRRFKYLFQVFKREYRYKELFDLVGQDFVLSEVERLINDKDEAGGGWQSELGRTYLIIAPSFPENSINQFQITYWATQGASANEIKAGSNLSFGDNGAVPGIMPESIFLVTDINRGEDGTDSQAALLDLKSALLRPQALITDEQLKNYCRRFFTNTNLQIEIRFGLIVRSEVEAVPTRSKEVVLSAQGFEVYPDRYQLDLLEENLNRYAVSSLPIRIVLQELEVTN